MKKLTIKHYFTAIACATGMVVLNAPAFEDNDLVNPDGKGVENFNELIALSATTNASAGADGFAHLVAHDINGVSGGKLVLDADGLTNGPYTVSVTLNSSGTNIVLGTFATLGSPADNDSLSETNETETNTVFGTGGTPFPGGVEALDIGSITISDTNGTVLLAGDFDDTTDALHVVYNANVRITPGPADPNAMGHAVAHFHANNGTVQQDKFMLIANRVTGNTTFTIVADGTTVGSVKSSKQGRVMLNKLAASVASLSQVQFLDPSNNVAFSVNF